MEFVLRIHWIKLLVLLDYTPEWMGTRGGWEEADTAREGTGRKGMDLNGKGGKPGKLAIMMRCAGEQRAP